MPREELNLVELITKSQKAINISTEEHRRFVAAKVRFFIFQGISVFETMAKLRMNHRDIKPANIMVRDEERLIFIDFGLVKTLTDKMIDEARTLYGKNSLEALSQNEKEIVS